jgi:hypothetical protein
MNPDGKFLLIPHRRIDVYAKHGSIRAHQKPQRFWFSKSENSDGAVTFQPSFMAQEGTCQEKKSSGKLRGQDCTHIDFV